MKKQTKIILLISLAVALIAGALYYFSRDYFPKYRWDENYLPDNDQPYGLKLFTDLLKAGRSKNDFVTVDRPLPIFLKTRDTSALYMFVGSKFITDSAGSLALLDFVKKGNNVFISSSTSQHSLFEYFTKDTFPFLRYNLFQDSTVDVVVNRKDTFTFDHQMYKKRTIYGWAGFDSAFFNDSLSIFGFKAVSGINTELVDCFKIKYGKGYFIFQFNPLLFTNYNLSKETGFKYANSLLSEFGRQKIYWDEFSKSPVSYSEDEPHETPLRFILSERSLKWGWYSMCIFLLVFLIFNSKRRQATIPLLPSNRNTTLEYINSIALLHHRKNSLVFLADEILRQFFSFIRHRYGISQNMERKKLIKELSVRSGVSIEILNDLFEKHSGVRYSPVLETKDLMEFYKLTEYFYQNCK